MENTIDGSVPLPITKKLEFTQFSALTLCVFFSNCLSTWMIMYLKMDFKRVPNNWRAKVFNCIQVIIAKYCNNFYNIALLLGYHPWQLPTEVIFHVLIFKSEYSGAKSEKDDIFPSFSSRLCIKLHYWLVYLLYLLGRKEDRDKVKMVSILVGSIFKKQFQCKKMKFLPFQRFYRLSSYVQTRDLKSPFQVSKHSKEVKPKTCVY